MKNFETELYESCPALAAFEHRHHLINDKGKERLKKLRETTTPEMRQAQSWQAQQPGQAQSWQAQQPGQAQSWQAQQPQPGAQPPEQAQPGQFDRERFQKTMSATHYYLKQMQQMLSRPEMQQDSRVQQVLNAIMQAQQALTGPWQG